MSLDLEDGDPELADASPRARRAAARKATAGDSDTPTRKPASKRASAPAQDRTEAEISSRLNRTFDRIAQALDVREDAELADIIREDKEAMGQGIVSLTRSIKVLRSPLLMALNFVEPVLAFGRVGRVLYGRWAYRRWQRAQEQPQETEPSPVAAIQ